METGQWALIAGSAEGLGKAFTLLLASQKISLIMVDSDSAALATLAGNVETRFGIKVIPVLLDLADPLAWEQCMKEVRSVECRMLIYNAAYSEVKPFLDHSPENLERFLDVNNRTSILLIRAFAGYLKECGKPGKILLMSSLAGLMSPQYIAPYAATKSFLVSLARSLDHEFRSIGISVTVCCSGIINTSRFHESMASGKPRMAEPMAVARYALKIAGRKPFCIHGWRNRLNYFLLSRLIPSSLASYFVNREMDRIYPRFKSGKTSG
jgi:short-subunit dehydrogenase